MGKAKFQKVKNKKQLHLRAFLEVLDRYEALKEKPGVSALDCSFTNGGASNPAQPSNIDYICDVDNIVADIVDKKDLQKFWNTYIIQDVEEPEFSKSYKNYCEQALGRLFIQRSIWPIAKYFFTQRKKPN